jgi:DNA-directed RNA polymerase subunit RPC12/RpoP
MSTFYYDVCPNCGSPNYEGVLGGEQETYKCLDCGDFFEFPEETSVDVKCPYCGDETGTIIHSIKEDGTFLFHCHDSCGAYWSDKEMISIV